MLDLISDHGTEWALPTSTLHFLVFVPTAIHVLLHKDDERSATGWIGLALLSPFLGSVLYWMFGINRIKSRAKAVQPETKKAGLFRGQKPLTHGNIQGKSLTQMQAGCAIHDAPYLPGNQVNPLINGDEAYPRMLGTIAEARHDIVLSSYIFDYDEAGRKFVEALGAARKRNVAVHVLIDGVLLAYGWRKTEKELQKKGIATARYFPLSPRFINLRNHRKILCVDGQVAFVGGMNIRQANMIDEMPRRPVQDIHFEVRGPVIDQIGSAFADDWRFATGALLNISKWSGIGDAPVIARALPDGPDENYQKLEWTLLTAINCAERTIRIVTPYFIPDRTIIRALQAASLRGVDIEIIVPRKSNIPFFDWAMRANFGELLAFGLKIHLSTPPFEHSKLFMVDDKWSFIGSANWDTRSLALNFEIGLECYDSALNGTLARIFADKKETSIALSIIECNHISPFIQVRNNFFRLLSPYL